MLRHVRDGIRVSCVSWVAGLPTQTDDPAAAREMLVPRQPIGRLDTPEEATVVVGHLASDKARFVTGGALVIDGGLTAGLRS